MTAAATADRGVWPRRADQLERLLGDPFAAGNPVGHAAVLDADERAEMLTAGERVLDGYGLGAEYVPPEYGGRLSRMDHLVEVVRSVYRRDPSLALGHSLSGFIGSVNVWAAGRDDQRRDLAGRLLGNRKVACAYHELAHGNDLAGMALAAVRDGDRLRLTGSKEVVTNIERADAFVVYARTDPRPGGRSHSLLLVDKALLPAGRVSYLPRFATDGMRGVQLGGVELRDCPVPADALLGEPGQGLQIALQSFQITRTTLVGMMTGLLDSGLRTTMRHVLSRRLYGRPVADLPHLRSVLVGAFVDLLVCECFAAVGARALHLLPEEASVYSAAVKYFVAGALIDAMHRLGAVLGAYSYLREGDCAIFPKLLRDMRPAAFAHIARPLCQASLLPQLPALARRSWRSGLAAPTDLFAIDRELPPVPYERLTVSAMGRERLSPSLGAGLDRMAGGADVAERQVRRLAESYLRQLHELAGVCASLPAAEQAVTASAAAYDRVSRYVAVLVASSCFGVWLHHRGSPDRFLGDPAWLTAALARLDTPPRRPPEAVQQRLFAELLGRYRDGYGFGVAERRLG